MRQVGAGFDPPVDSYNVRRPSRYADIKRASVPLRVFRQIVAHRCRSAAPGSFSTLHSLLKIIVGRDAAV